MRLARSLQKNIFCFEGEWGKTLKDKSTIKSCLDFLQTNYGIKHIHKTCGTLENVMYYTSILKQKKYEGYSIVYLALHGRPGRVWMGKELVDLEELTEVLGDSCEGRIVYLGCCSTLRVSETAIRNFKKKTKALCVCGFREEVDFLESSVFDMLVLGMMQNYRNMRFLEKNLNKNYGKIIKRLGFRFIY